MQGEKNERIDREGETGMEGEIEGSAHRRSGGETDLVGKKVLKKLTEPGLNTQTHTQTTQNNPAKYKL